ncbi:MULTISPECIES: WXG100 family type VII secretion target [unclassified Microbacterium]|uniref:WXG100 family type VII secretion target n=1 Tax=unclassified Microbacterium TaxID=2609290 RepID=UPI00216A982A|nr:MULTISPECIES: WXG100 family type VII secretion target [unclassified Microbacterium]MCS3843482.1 WXG100 family type VII secretion target [Microbacterium sp. AK031]MDP3950576.1 WXG100 family type VII secretion target [Microbacterium sp.]
MAHDFGATYSEMEGAAQRLRDGRQTVTDTLKELQGIIDDLVQDGFKTENASEQYSSSYNDLTSSLDDAAEAVNDMATALDQMADKIRDTDQL